jgi:hypothetical protein
VVDVHVYQLALDWIVINYEVRLKFQFHSPGFDDYAQAELQNRWECSQGQATCRALGNRLQIRLDGADFIAFLGNRTHYCPANAAKSALAQPDFRYDS